MSGDAGAASARTAAPADEGAGRRRSSLRTRLVVAASILVAAVIGLQSYFEIRLFERQAEDDLREEGHLTAQAVADDVELRGGLPIGPEVARSLHEFLYTVPTTRTISIVAPGAGGRPVVVASTSSSEQPERPEALELAAAAMRGETTGWHVWTEPLMSYATPIMRGDAREGAVVVTVTRVPLAELRTRGRRITLYLAPLAIVLLTILIDQLARQLIYRPLAAIRQTMRRAGSGESGVRAPVLRRDELGAVAVGLNQMLERIEGFSAALQERVEEATRELRASNAERVEGYRRILGLREALARSEQLATVGQAAASVAHQVGTPLNLVSGYVQLLLADPALDAQVARRLRTVQEQIGRVADAVRGLLDHARPASPSVPIDLPTLLMRLRDVATPRLDAAGVAMRLQLEERLPLVLGGETDLELALLNLVTNAIDAMPGGGSLEIGASADSQHVRLVVRDSGSGIPADLLPRIFDPWITTKAAGLGAGLGLSITRDVITRLGGTIGAANRPEGGAEFTVTLPTTEEAVAPDRA